MKNTSFLKKILLSVIGIGSVKGMENDNSITQKSSESNVSSGEMSKEIQKEEKQKIQMSKPIEIDAEIQEIKLKALLVEPIDAEILQEKYIKIWPEPECIGDTKKMEEEMERLQKELERLQKQVQDI